MILKNRYGLNKKKIAICVDYYKMRIYDDPDFQDNPQKSPTQQNQTNVNNAVNTVSNIIDKDNKDKFKKIINFDPEETTNG
jgi:hypothetical protein